MNPFDLRLGAFKMKSLIVAIAYCCLCNAKLLPMTFADEQLVTLFRNCVSSIAEKYLRPENNIVVIVRTYYDDFYTKAVSLPQPVYRFTESMKTKHANNHMHKGVLIVFSSLPMPVILQRIPWNHSSRFVIASRSANEIRLIARDLWEERILNAIIFSVHGRSLLIHTYDPFNPIQCGRTWVKQSGLCNATHHIIEDLFPIKTNDIKGCPLKVTLLERPPSVTISDTGIIGGWEVEILNTAARALNATPVYNFLHSRPWYLPLKNQFPNINLLMVELNEKHSDVVAGSLMYTTSVSQYSEPIDYLESLCITLAVPNSQTDVGAVNTMVRNPLLASISVLVFFFLTALFWFVFILKKIPNPFDRALGTVSPPISGTILKDPKSSTLRFILVLWLWQCFLVSKVLEADVRSGAIAPSTAEQLETLDDVLFSKTQINGESFLIQEILTPYAFRKGRVNIEINGVNVESALRYMAVNKNISYFGTRANLLYTFTLHPEFSKNIYIQKECNAEYSPVLQTGKNSPYFKKLAEKVQALAESGITRQLAHESYYGTSEKLEKQKQSSGYKPMKMQEIYPAFTLLISGVILSTIVWLMELTCFYSQQICTTKCQFNHFHSRK